MKKKENGSKILGEFQRIEKIILELENWKEGSKLSKEVSTIVGEVINSNLRDEKLEFFKKNLKLLRENQPKHEKLYLSEIIRKENITFKGNNNLILSPVGSGKTTFIKEILEEDPSDCIMLVSNTALKNSISPERNEERMLKANNTFTSKNRRIHGNKKYKVHVMSYSEFGNKVRFNNDFIKGVKYVFCDEIHSLPHYQSFNDSTSLAIAIKTLFESYDNIKIFYFTATDEHLKELKRKDDGVLSNVDVYDFRDHPDIRQYLPLSEYKFNHIEQIRPHLKARIKTFNYFGYKCLAFSRTIDGQKRISKIAEEEGFKPIILWSINNKAESLQMSKEQLECRDHLLNFGEIPDQYNFLVINSAMQEGWDLIDDKVKLAIMNTTSETERVQATGRLRNDIDILVYKVKKDVKADVTLNIPEEFLNVPLVNSQKDELCAELNMRNVNGSLVKWRAIKDFINKDDSKYTVEESTKTIDGKRTRVSIISIIDDFE